MIIRGNPGTGYRSFRHHALIVDRILADADSGPLRAGLLIRFNKGDLYFVEYVNTSGAYVVPLMGIHRTIAGKDAHFAGGGRTISATSMVERVDPVTLGITSQEFKRYVTMASKVKKTGKGNGGKGNGNGTVSGKGKAGRAGKSGTGNGGASSGGGQQPAISTPTPTPTPESPEWQQQQPLEVPTTATEIEQLESAGPQHEEIAGMGLASFVDGESEIDSASQVIDSADATGAGSSTAATTTGAGNDSNDSEGAHVNNGKTGNGKVKAKAKSAGAKREKVVKTVRNCACGCGTETSSHFAPGHDARMHGWIKKLADGRMKPSELPAPVRNKLDLTQTAKGFKAGAPHFWKD